jgi:DNA polymerase
MSSLSEEQVYLCDQRVNDRGVALDLPAIDLLTQVTELYLERCKQRIRIATNGRVKSLNAVAQILAYLKDRFGLVLEDLSASTVDKEFAKAEDPLLKEILQLRSYVAKSSVSKLKKMVSAACADGRVRGMLYYHGADTGRWTSLLIQLQNLPRGMAFTNAHIDSLFALLKERGPTYWLTYVEDHYEAPMHVISSMLRGCFVAAPGHEFLVVDYASIESRVLAWVAGQKDMLKLFHAGGDLYKDLASTMFGVPVIEVTKDQRQLGKFGILSCGYQIGTNGMSRMITGKVKDPDGMAQQIVDTYRSKYTKIRNLWYDIEAEARDQVEDPIGYMAREVGRSTFSMPKEFLYLHLPSGRRLAYPFAKLVPGRFQASSVVSYKKQVNNQWRDTETYGGKLVENLVQSTARCLLAGAMVSLEKAGYPIVMSVHDELVVEAPVGALSLSRMEELMCELPDWAEGLPLAAEGFISTRYRK